MKEPTGEILWADTITVRDKATMGGMVSAKDNSRAHVEAVVARVFQQSFDAISSSPQVRAFAMIHPGSVKVVTPSTEKAVTPSADAPHAELTERQRVIARL